MLFEIKRITGADYEGAAVAPEPSYWPSFVICLPIDEYEVLDYDEADMPAPVGADAVVKTDRGAQYYFIGEEKASHDDRMRCDDQHWELSHSQGYWTVRLYSKMTRQRRCMEALSEAGIELAQKWNATAATLPELDAK